MTWVQLLLVLGYLKNTWIPTIENLTGPGWVKGPAFHLGAIDVVSGGTRVGLVGSHDTCWHLLPAGEKMLGGATARPVPIGTQSSPRLHQAI